MQAPTSVSVLALRERSGLHLLILGLFLLASSLAHATPGAAHVAGPTSRGALPTDITPVTIAEGRNIFHGVGNCYQCHGKNGTGTFWAPALNDAEHVHLVSASFDEIENRIRTGVPKPKRHLAAMPPLGGADLTESQLRAVAAYVFSIDRSHSRGELGATR